MTRIKVVSPTKMQWRWLVLSHVGESELMEAISAVKMAQQSELNIPLKTERLVIMGFQTRGAEAAMW